MSGIVGIGFFIWDAYQQNYVSEIILAVVYIGAVGLGFTTRSRYCIFTAIDFASRTTVKIVGN
ncbi:MAG: hypothetical protein QNJ72_10805 [Pleurocapsa sp. MO_226.B13]|nr:hypothetical protein [Pleurocapsa sp. MO_226.B13]